MPSVIRDILLKSSGGKIFLCKKSSSLASTMLNITPPDKAADLSNASPPSSKRRQLFPFSEHQIAQVLRSVMDMLKADGNSFLTAKLLNVYSSDKIFSTFSLGKKNMWSLGIMNHFLPSRTPKISARSFFSPPALSPKIFILETRKDGM